MSNPIRKVTKREATAVLEQVKKLQRWSAQFYDEDNQTTDAATMKLISGFYKVRAALEHFAEHGE